MSVKPECWCATCRPVTLFDQRFVVCPECGDKRCVRAKDHTAPCAKVDLYAHNLWVERRMWVVAAEVRERVAAWLEGQGQPGYAHQIRFLDLQGDDVAHGLGSVVSLSFNMPPIPNASAPQPTP